MAADQPSDNAINVPPGGRIEVWSPADGRLLTTVVRTSAEDVGRAAHDLRSAQEEWEALGPSPRAVHLKALRDWILDNESHLLDIMQDESGKVRQDAAFEPVASADLISYYAARARRILAEQHPRPHGVLTAAKRLTVRHRPHQLVGVISPWNFPLFIPVADSAPALLAGAAVLLKPSEETPLTAIELGRAWREIGAPDVFRVLTGDSSTGSAVVNSVDYIAFTGSAATGRRIASRAAERLIPASLELGGKDAMIVLDDANVDRAVNGALWGGMFNAGQVCTSVERVYVQEGIYDEFIGKLVEAVGGLRQGIDRVAGEQEIGAMATRQQAQIVAAHVEDAVAHGARILIGGPDAAVHDSNGYWIAPTVLVDVDHSMRCMREETFGPTLPVVKVRDEDEALSLANDSPYGLSATVWTGSRKRGERLACRLSAGAVNVNDVFTNVISPPVPMAGWGESGLGSRFGGAQGLLRYTRPQAVTASRLTPDREVLWYPYSLKRSRLAARIMHFAVGRGPRRFRSAVKP
jgi:betaine-aldehyde dehydrogenase